MPDLRRLLVTCLLTACLFSACAPGLQPGSTLELASRTANSVQVDVALELDSTGQAWLTATFTPSDAGTHLYSMDLPRDGVAGLGRPTLLELIPGSRIQAAGVLQASVPASELNGEGLLVYPAGPVTLRLAVVLPAGEGWFDEEVSVTYMACSDNSCRPPVIDSRLPIRVPGADSLQVP